MPKYVATVRSRELLVKLNLEEYDLILREIWLKYFGHVEHSGGAFSHDMIYTLMEGTSKGGGVGDMKTTDRKQLS